MNAWLAETPARTGVLLGGAVVLAVSVLLVTAWPGTDHRLPMSVPQPISQAVPDDGVGMPTWREIVASHQASRARGEAASAELAVAPAGEPSAAGASDSPAAGAVDGDADPPAAVTAVAAVDLAPAPSAPAPAEPAPAEAGDGGGPVGATFAGDDTDPLGPAAMAASVEPTSSAIIWRGFNGGTSADKPADHEGLEPWCEQDLAHAAPPAETSDPEPEYLFDPTEFYVEPTVVTQPGMYISNPMSQADRAVLQARVQTLRDRPEVGALMTVDVQPAGADHPVFAGTVSALGRSAPSSYVRPAESQVVRTGGGVYTSPHSGIARQYREFIGVYVAHEGDTPESIAEKVFGDARLAHFIFRQNQPAIGGSMRHDRDVRPGLHIEIWTP